MRFVKLPGFMATVFGESGPTNVEVLNHPTRRQSNGAPGAPGPNRRMSADSEAVAAEAGDHFEMLPTSGTQAPRLPQRPTTVQAPLSSGSDRGRGIERWSSSSSRIMASSKVTASRRFAQPLASEGHGSVFPVELPLSKRRAFEVEIIKRFDRRRQLLDVNTHVGEFWFIIDAIWMSTWVNFVMGKSGPPGPISNHNLFTHYSGNRRESMLVHHAASSARGVMASRPDLKLKDGLRKLKDYRAVHPLVWYLFREIYSADDAPELCRWKAEIYQAEVQITRKLKCCEEAHTKAVYELRRFCAKIKEDMGE
ncbi:unnamed protein product [Ectocarpus sp. CCAP 1310/34]|nr:unnamed protein product [Ectocarpus sp. CCAP 1310/34]